MYDSYVFEGMKDGREKDGTFGTQIRAPGLNLIDLKFLTTTRQQGRTVRWMYLVHFLHTRGPMWVTLQGRDF